jgi:hypothetical protein
MSYSEIRSHVPSGIPPTGMYLVRIGRFPQLWGAIPIGILRVRGSGVRMPLASLVETFRGIGMPHPQHGGGTPLFDCGGHSPSGFSYCQGAPAGSVTPVGVGGSVSVPTGVSIPGGACNTACSTGFARSTPSRRDKHSICKTQSKIASPLVGKNDAALYTLSSIVHMHYGKSSYTCQIDSYVQNLTLSASRPLQGCEYRKSAP